MQVTVFNVAWRVIQRDYVGCILKVFTIRGGVGSSVTQKKKLFIQKLFRQKLTNNKFLKHKQSKINHHHHQQIIF